MNEYFLECKKTIKELINKEKHLKLKLKQIEETKKQIILILIKEND